MLIRLIKERDETIDNINEVFQNNYSNNEMIYTNDGTHNEILTKAKDNIIKLGYLLKVYQNI